MAQPCHYNQGIWVRLKNLVLVIIPSQSPGIAVSIIVQRIHPHYTANCFFIISRNKIQCSDINLKPVLWEVVLGRTSGMYIFTKQNLDVTQGHIFSQYPLFKVRHFLKRVYERKADERIRMRQLKILPCLFAGTWVVFQYAMHVDNEPLEIYHIFQWF